MKGGMIDKQNKNSLQEIENYTNNLTVEKLNLTNISIFIKGLSANNSQLIDIEDRLNKFTNKSKLLDKIPKLYKLYNMYTLLVKIPPEYRNYKMIIYLNTIRPVYNTFLKNVNSNTTLNKTELRMLDNLII